jgi:ribosome maturation factor RimP
MSWQQAIEKTVTGLGLELVETERSAGGLLRVFIDRLQAGEFVNVDDCERVTRQLQYVLEVENCDYSRLEVSSPGLDRPLRTPEHYARFVGVEIDITLRMPFQGRKKYRGVLHSGVAEGGWRLVFGESGKEQALDFQLDEVREARLVPVIDFKKDRKKKTAAPTPDGEQN